jgi:hypothetical protein
MFKKVFLSFQVAGISLFFLLLGTSMVLANTNDGLGPDGTQAGLETLFKKLFDKEYSLVTEDDKIIHSAIGDNAIKSNNIENGSVTLEKINGGENCAGKSFVFGESGAATCSETSGSGAIGIGTGIVGNGTGENPLQVDFTSVQKKITGNCAVGMYVTSINEDQLTCSAPRESGDDLTNEIQNGNGDHGLQKFSDDNSLGLKSCGRGEALVSNGQTWSCVSLEEVFLALQGQNSDGSTQDQKASCNGFDDCTFDTPGVFQ